VVSESFPQLAKEIVLTKADKVKIHWYTHIVLQPLRDVLNEGVSDVQSEIKICLESGIRNVALNSAVGGVRTSDHLYRRFSIANDFVIGDNTKLYLETAKAFCYGVRRYVKQFIFYLPYTDREGRSRGNFLHVSLRDQTNKKWDVLYCGSRGAREYFRTYEEAENYMRNI
jgi:hypothetical protein